LSAAAGRFARSVAVGLIAAFSGRAPTEAQVAPTHRIAVSLDYVGVDGLYLGVGSEQGAAVGDTLTFFADSLDTQALAHVRLTSVTRRRSVGELVTARAAPAAGRTFFVELPVPAPSAGPTVEDPAPGRGSREPSPAARPREVARLTGRLSVDVDARETRTSWSGDLFGETVRRFVTPTTRLSIAANGLPGGFSLRANLRGSYRYDDLGRGPAPLSVRAYELAAVSAFEKLPVQLILGRFANPYETYSGYWDGILVRVGRESGLGLGTVAGYEPHLQDEGFSQALPKLTAFVDYSARGGDWRYDADVSVHFARPGTAFALRHTGWTQRLSVAGLDVVQRIRMVHDGGRWHVGEARLRGSLDVGGRLRVLGSYGRAAYMTQLDAASRGGVSAAPSEVTREEATLGVALDGRRVAVTAEVGGARRGAEAPGLSVAGTTHITWGAHRVGLAARRWSRSGVEVLSLTPALDVRLGGLQVRTAYRFYTTRTTTSSLSTNAMSADVGFVLARELHLTLGAERQWGENLAGSRVHAGVWRAF